MDQVPLGYLTISKSYISRITRFNEVIALKMDNPKLKNKKYKNLEFGKKNFLLCRKGTPRDTDLVVLNNDNSYSMRVLSRQKDNWCLLSLIDSALPIYVHDDDLPNLNLYKVFRILKADLEEFV